MCCVCSCFIFPSSAAPSLFCRRHLPPPRAVCRHLLCRSNLDQKHEHTGPGKKKKSQAFPWHLYTSFLLIILGATAPPAHSYPTHSAPRALSSGEVAWLYIIHGPRDVSHVSYGRSDKTERRREYQEQRRRERRRGTNPLAPVASHSALHFKCACWCTGRL